MSNASRQRVLRAVRLLPDAVRVGRASDEDTSLETSERKHRLAGESEKVDRSELTEAQEEIKKLRSELRTLESDLVNEKNSTRTLTIEMNKMSEDIKRERSDLRESALREAAEQKETARREGYEEGQGKGYTDGIEKAEQEKRAEYEGRFADAINLLNEMVAELRDSREKLARAHAPQLIRLWEVMLEKMLVAKVSLDPEVVERLLESILRRVSDRERIMVYLNSADMSMIEENKEHLIDSIRGVKVFELLSDNYIDKGSCLIETNLGIYDARWKTQLEQISGEVQALLMESMASDDTDSDA